MLMEIKQPYILLFFLPVVRTVVCRMYERYVCELRSNYHMSYKLMLELTQVTVLVELIN
jgi:hypothetical protein